MAVQQRLAVVRQEVSDRLAKTKHALSSWQNFKDALQVHDTALDEHGHREKGPTWSNEDLDPTPPERRTWRTRNYAVFFVALGFGNWTLGSTMIGIGLTAGQSIGVIFLSQCISSLAMLANSRCASVYHIGYPIVARSVFGMWGSYYFVGARAALAIVWYGVQCESDLLLSSTQAGYERGK